MPTPTSGSTFSVFAPTGNSNLDALLAGLRWGPTTLNTSLTISYSFPTASSTWSESDYDYPAGSEPSNGFLALTSAQQTQVRKIFTMISSYTNLQFSEITETATSVGDIRLGFTDMPVNSDGTGVLAYAYMPDGPHISSTLQGDSYPSSGDVWLNARRYAGFSSEPGSYYNLALIHEIGHALGLKHPFKEEYGFNAIDPDYDIYDHTVMSYTAVTGEQYSTVSYFPTTLMEFDVYALQYLYGKNTTYYARNTTYTFYADQDYNQTLWDADGTDTIVYESTTGGTINLQAGSWLAVGKPLIYKNGAGTVLSQSTKTVQILAGVTIENATGGEGADTLTGNAVANTLLGRGGNDTLNGLAGNDTLNGLAGNDRLNGGTGADTMTGGDGSDTYHVDNAGDVVVETNASASTGRTDRVNSYLSAYTLGANIETGRIMAAGTANMTGNSLNNTLYAGAGNNVLDGGAGADTASYHFYSTSAITVSLALTAAQATDGSGSDTLISIENLIGSTYNDKFTGNAANNHLNGGVGADTMIGGAGNDVYVVDNVGDVVTEELSGGTDRVNSYLSAYTLGANIENGRIMAAGTANMTGNDLNNTLYAGADNNVLDGGAGSDTVSYLYATSGITVSLATTAAQATGGSGSDTLISIESLIGGGYADTLTGNSGNNTLHGGAGNDTLIGGLGADLFVFNSVAETGLTSSTWDTITDFKTSDGDKIDLRGIDANTVLAGDQAFSAPVVGGTFSGAFANAGDLYFDNVAQILYGNSDDDAAAEFAIALTGVTSLSAANFVL